jgi:hypothetical protein
MKKEAKPLEEEWAMVFHHTNVQLLFMATRVHDVPQLFQQSACTQVIGIVGTIKWDKTVVRKCPSCLQEHDTCTYVLHCSHAGCVKNLLHTINLLEDWLTEADTDPDLLGCIEEYAYFLVVAAQWLI